MISDSRRDFLRTMIGGLAVGAAVRTFPFRVFSFPTEIVRAQLPPYYPIGYGLGDFIIQPEWDFYQVAEMHEKFKSQGLFNLPRDTGRGTQTT
jgi:hypothetical protein